MKKNGFGLIEAIITIGILAAISAVLIESYLKSQSTFDIQTSKATLQTATRNALDSINNWVKLSSSVISSYTNDSQSYTTNNTTLILEVPAIDANQNIISGIYDYVVFKPDATYPHELKEIVYPASESARTAKNRIVNQKLQTLGFIYYNSSNNEITQNYEETVKIKTTISSQEVIRDTTNTQTFSTTTKLRNN